MQIIAHRGASGEFRENSLLAFEQAILQGCDGIELDVQFHQASGEFILLHDSYLNRGKTKVHFNQLSLTELIKPDVNAKDNICTLQQALQCIKQQCLINVELKSATQGAPLRDEIKQLKQLLQQAQKNKVITQQQLIISSFNHHALMLVAEYLPKVTTAALIASCPIGYAEFCQQIKVKLLNLSIECINREIIHDAHRRGLQVWVYTVDHPEQIKLCLDYQVDAIFTNFPMRSRQTVLTLKRKFQGVE